MQFTKTNIIIHGLLLACLTITAQHKLSVRITEAAPVQDVIGYHKPGDSLIQYTGRVEMRNNDFPRLWAPGANVRAKFIGSMCEVFFSDQVLYGKSHNYIEVVLDNMEPVRLPMKWKNNKITIGGLADSSHMITLCKNTEAGIGYIDFAGINCKELISPEAKPGRKIEFIGNSITCGSGMDLSEIACDQGQWYDQHNAWLSYGPLTSRALHAQWQLSAVSGIGLIHSCCNMSITMPQVYDKINMRDDSISWDFKQYIPDVVTICLGQNDGVQDSAIFCSAYIYFIQVIRSRYPKADIICLTSPMGDTYLNGVLKTYLSSVAVTMNNSGDKRVHTYFFAERYHNGCGGHPDLNEHRQIAAELTAYIRKIKHW